MDDAVSQSLFVVGSWTFHAPYSASIIELETPQVDASSSANNTPVFRTQSEFSAHIPHLSHAGRAISVTVSLPPASSTEDLYMLPDWVFPKKYQEEGEDTTLPGFIVNLGTKKCKAIKPHLAPKYKGHAVTSGDHIYYLGQPPDSYFESYDTLSQKWEERELLELYDGPGIIEGSAVLGDTILFYIDGCYGPSIMAYNVGTKRWYPVAVLNDWCYRLVGVSVVLNKIIYALAMGRDSVVALELIKSQDKDGDLVFTCKLRKEYEVPGMEDIKFEHVWENSYRWIQHLVHLGKYNFCLVQSCNLDGVKRFHQYIQLTSIELREKESTVTGISVHKFKVPAHGQFNISHCFSMPPKCKTTTAFKQGKGFLKFKPEHKAEIMTLPPELLQFQEDVPKKSFASSQSRDDAKTTPNVQVDVPKKSFESSQSRDDANTTPKVQVDVPKKSFASSQSRDDADTTPKVQEDVPKKSFASSQSKDDTTPKVQEDVPKKSFASSQTKDDTTPKVKEDVPKKSVVATKSNVPSKASTVTGYQSLDYARKVSFLGDGHFIWVTNLPPDTNFLKLRKRLEKFGPIKDFFLRVNTSESYAYVEYERATSKQDAIQTSLLEIGDHIAVIEEKRGTGCLYPGRIFYDLNRSSSKSSRNKLKKRGKDSRSKTTREGLPTRITQVESL